jgi:membrane-associated phospholipid phosphatase
MMRSPLMPFVLAVSVTVLVAVAARMEPYFAGDVATTRIVQSVSPNPESWATPISRLAPAPGKYFVIAVVLTAAFFVGGWRGMALLAAFLLLEQYGAESTKALIQRPRPSRDLVSVFGTFGGYTFPSTTITFFSVTFGALGILALVRKNAPMRQPVMWISFGMVLLGCVARVALGAHWPSDVLLTAMICMVWIWAAARVVLRNA